MLSSNADRPSAHVEFELFTRPIPQARHRHRNGGKGTYDPCSEQKQEFVRQALQVCAQPPVADRAKPFRCSLEFCFARPKSHYLKSGRLRKGARALATGRPDVDNLIKFVFDALNGVYFVDDAQCVQVAASKAYAQHNKVGVKLQFFA